MTLVTATQSERDAIGRLSPSVRYIVSVLAERIRSRHYSQGQRLPSERDLCVEFSVSRPTVRQAIDELENCNLIRRLVGHRPVVWDSEIPIVNTEVRTRRSIALWITGNPRDLGPMAMARSIHQALTGDTYRLVMACPHGGGEEDILDSERAGLLQLADDEDIAGVIVWYLGGAKNLPALQKLRERGKLMVFVDRQPPTEIEADFVGVYNELSAFEAVQYLIQLGHRYIAHITNLEAISSVRERFAGYQKALREAGIPFRPELVYPGNLYKQIPDRDENHWNRVIDLFLQMPGPPTAVFAVNDYSAMCFVETARRRGLRVPEDVSVIGFDNSERWSVGTPFLTSVSQPFEQMGAEAVKLLEQRLRGETTSAYRHIMLTAPLVVRTSVAPII